MSRSKTTAQANQSNPVARYLRETRGELRKVTWPTRDEAWRLTAIVLAVTLATAVFLWFFDTVFSHGLNLLISQMVGV
ncbi:MAG: preprotein translocase subunit SecE [Candidatus Promineifilaceae bacterium]